MSNKLQVQIITIIVIVSVVIGIIVFKGLEEEKRMSTTLISEIWDAEWELTELRSQGVPVLINFTASWCIPCKTFNPILEKTKEKYGDKLIIKLVDIDEYREKTLQYPVYAVPTQVLYNADGTPYQPSEGVRIFGFKSYEKDNNPKSNLTVHEGAMTEKQLQDVLRELGLDD